VHVHKAERATRHKAAPPHPQPAAKPHASVTHPPAPRHSDAKGANTAAAGGPRSPAKQPASTSAPAPVTAPLPQLYRLLHAAIERHKHYPLFARRLGQAGTARVAFRLAPDGNVQKVRLVASSGYRALDHAAVDAIYGIAPFAPARHYLQRHRNFEVAIVFRSY